MPCWLHGLQKSRQIIAVFLCGQVLDRPALLLVVVLEMLLLLLLIKHYYKCCCCCCC
jgi:hypothetical protein